MARILILIGGHLCTAPRPQKEADTLAAAGHQVTVAGVWFDPGLIARDRALLEAKTWDFQPVLDFRPGQPSRWGVRLQAKLSRQLYQRWQIKTPALLGYGARQMYRFARSVGADLTIVHSEAGLWVGQQLIDQGYAVGVDFEDWFSQDLLPSAHQARPVDWIADLEATLLRRCAYRLTTSQALAQALADHYQVSPPRVVYNVFPPDPVWPHSPAISTPPSLPSAHAQRPIRLHWFSQTIGPGRGLELLFEALPHLVTAQPVEIHLRGHCSPQAHPWLAQQIPPGWVEAVYLHPTVPNAELPARIAENDIGLALEQPTPPSRNLTITNKLFQYLQAGLAVIATDTAGQREVFDRAPTIGHLVPSHNPIALAAAIADLVNHPTHRQIAQAAAHQAATTDFNWAPAATQILLALEDISPTPTLHPPTLLTHHPTTLSPSHHP